MYNILSIQLLEYRIKASLPSFPKPSSFRIGLNYGHEVKMGFRVKGNVRIQYNLGTPS